MSKITISRLIRCHHPHLHLRNPPHKPYLNVNNPNNLIIPALQLVQAIQKIATVHPVDSNPIVGTHTARSITTIGVQKITEDPTTKDLVETATDVIKARLSQVNPKKGKRGSSAEALPVTSNPTNAMKKDTNLDMTQ